MSNILIYATPKWDNFALFKNSCDNYIAKRDLIIVSTPTTIGVMADVYAYGFCHLDKFVNHATTFNELIVHNIELLKEADMVIVFSKEEDDVAKHLITQATLRKLDYVEIRLFDNDFLKEEEITEPVKTLPLLDTLVPPSKKDLHKLIDITGNILIKYETPCEAMIKELEAVDEKLLPDHIFMPDLKLLTQSKLIQRCDLVKNILNDPGKLAGLILSIGKSRVPRLCLMPYYDIQLEWMLDQHLKILFKKFMAFFGLFHPELFRAEKPHAGVGITPEIFPKTGGAVWIYSLGDFALSKGYDCLVENYLKIAPKDFILKNFHKDKKSKNDSDDIFEIFYSNDATNTPAKYIHQNFGNSPFEEGFYYIAISKAKTKLKESESV